MEIAVAKGAAGRIQVEVGNRAGRSIGRFICCVGIEFKDVIAVPEFGRFQLLEDVFVREDTEILRHGSPVYWINSSRSFRRISMRMDE